jgi:hypothetical protein
MSKKQNHNLQMDIQHSEDQSTKLESVSSRMEEVSLEVQAMKTDIFDMVELDWQQSKDESELILRIIENVQKIGYRISGTSKTP